MADEQYQLPEDLTINGRFLIHYLKTMERMQDTFELKPPENLDAFNKFVYYLRSIINDEGRVKKIDKAILEEKERLNKPEFKKLSADEKEFIAGFRVINGCMKYLSHTLNINKNQGKELTDVNGLLLDHYLKTMERMQAVFSRKGSDNIAIFNKYVYYMRSIITDDARVKEIDASMIEEFRRLESINMDQVQKQFLVGYKIISGCMTHIDHTMKINKRQVKILADQTDPNMPQPPKTYDEDEVLPD